jgi:beta-lactamase class D
MVHPKHLIMKYHFFLIGLTILVACNGSNEKKSGPAIQPSPKEVPDPEFQQIIDAAGVSGSVLIYDPQKDIYYSNNFERCKTGFLPASTFKIVNSIIALETGVVAGDTTLLKWDGQTRQRPEWNKNMTLNEAYHVSCVPCYQEIARKIGAKRMRSWLDTLHFGHMVFDTASIDLFWLEGESKISQFEQIDFLKRLYYTKLPVSERTFTSMKKMMVLDDNQQYKLSGKTGWAIRNENNYGWFVGYVEKGNAVYFVATNIEPKEAFNMDMFPKIRSEITLAALSKLGFIQ